MVIATIGRSVFGVNPAFAVCSDHSPVTNETVTCDTNPPNPDPAGVTAISGATNVTVNILPGAGITTSDNGVLLNGSSQAANQGTITISGDEFDGMTLRGQKNLLTNRGTIGTSGVNSEGLYSQDPNNTLINGANGHITTTGENSTGMIITSSDGNILISTTNTLINRGAITTTATLTADMLATGSNNTLTNSGTMLTTGASSSALVAFGNNNSITNTGSITVTGSSAAGILPQGDVLGPVVNSGTITGTGPGDVGIFATFATAPGPPVSITNTTAGVINISQGQGIFAINPANIENDGSITGTIGILINQGTSSTVTNNGAITGTARAGIQTQDDGDVLENFGTIRNHLPKDHIIASVFLILTSNEIHRTR